MKLIDNKTKIKLFYEMLRIREIENTIASNYKFQKMRCPIHLSIGQEAIAVGVCQNLKKIIKLLLRIDLMLTILQKVVILIL